MDYTSRLPAGVEVVQRMYDDDLYGIEPGHMHCHPFRIPPLGSINIAIIHTAINSQDMSLRYWFSTQPMEDSMYDNIYNRGFFPVLRQGTSWKLSDEALVSTFTNHFFTGPVHMDLWLNVQNLQNAVNGYQLTFSLDN